jgi:hypothetical protein
MAKRPPQPDDLVGATVAFTGYGSRRPPAAEFKLLRVQGGTRPRCVLEYVQQGVTKTYIDVLSEAPTIEHLLLRYRVVPPSVAFDAELWESRQPIAPVDSAQHFELPAFQTAPAEGAPAKGRSEADETFIAFVLSAGLKHDAREVVNVRVGDGLTRWTRRPELLLAYQARIAKDLHVKEAAARQGGLGLGAGELTLKPWQAAVAARLRQLALQRESFVARTELEVELEIGGAPVRRKVALEAMRTQDAVLVHAATGAGKTFAALAGFGGCLVYAIVFPSACRQWEQEARKLGLTANWINSTQRCRPPWGRKGRGTKTQNTSEGRGTKTQNTSEGRGTKTQNT